MGKKESYFQWYRENVNVLSQEERRWALSVIEEFKWHDKLEQQIEGHIAAGNRLKEYCLQLKEMLPYMDGFDARLMMDSSLERNDFSLPNEDVRALDLKLAAYCKYRSGAYVKYNENKNVLQIYRRIKDPQGKELGVACGKDLPYRLYPELASLVEDFPKAKRRDLQKRKFKKEADVREQYNLGLKGIKNAYIWRY